MASHANQPKYKFGLVQTPASAWSTSATRSAGSDSSSSSRLRQAPTPRNTSTSVRSSSVRSKTPLSCRQASSSGGVDSRANIVAIVEGRGLARGEIGLACIDLNRPVLCLSQFSDSQTYVKILTKIQTLQPIEIILPNTVCENGVKTKLYQLITDQFHRANIATVQRKYFNENKGLDYIKQLGLPEFSAVQMEVRSKYYCLAATAALLKYIEFIQNTIYATSSLKIVFKGSEQTTMIDATTAMNLELLRNRIHLKNDHTLFGVMNYTKTAMGARLLCSNILQPCSNVETIRLRLDAVAELTEREDLFYALQTVVSRFTDVDQLLSQCVQLPKQETVKTAEARITSVIVLKQCLELVPPLVDALAGCDNPLMRAYADALADDRFDVIRRQMMVVIHDDTKYQRGSLNMRAQKCFAVKPNINGLLDVARRTYTEIVDDIAEIVHQLAEQHALPLTTAYSCLRGFHMQLRASSRQTLPDSLPAEFLKVTRSGATITCSSADMIKMNDRANESLQEIYLMTNIVVSALLKDIHVHLGCLYKLTECIAMVDMLVSFAHSCTLFNYVRPEFTDTLAIKQARHPVLEKISPDPIVPNNVYASSESSFIVITGPNMSGKSTYLRQIALLQIMAQIGSFVPAEYAAFTITRQIFSRIGSDDDLETNASTFMVEMREINYIIQNADKSALIIIDELGRSTSADEGVGICYAICEYLLSLKAYTFFATHFMELTNLESIYPNVDNYHFEMLQLFASGGEEKVTNTHVLSRGKSRHQLYGLQLAEMSTLPENVVKDAKQIAKTLEAQKQSRVVDPETLVERATFKLGRRLIQVARNSRLDDDSLRTYLKSLKSQYRNELSAITAQPEQ